MTYRHALGFAPWSSLCVWRAVLRVSSVFFVDQSPYLSQQFINNQPVNVGQTEIAPLKTISQFLVIESEQLQDRRVQIVNVYPVLDGVETELVSLTDRDAGFDPTARQPHREGVRMMVAAVVGSALHHRSA